MRLFGFFFLMLALSSCKHDPVFGDSPAGPLNPCAADEVSFEAEVLPILNAHCNSAGCHFDASSNPAILINYAGIFSSGSIVPGDTAASELYLRISSSDPDLMMPPPDSARLSASERSRIAGWILQNAPNNNCTP